MIGIGTLIVLGWIGCGTKDQTAEVNAASTQLQQGSFSTAQTSYDAILTADANNVDAAIQAAYVYLLQGQYDKSEAILNAVVTEDAAVQQDLQLRKAIVKITAGQFDQAKDFAQQSNSDFGKIIAAEVSLLDGEVDDAIGFLEGVSSSQYKILAKDYLSLLNSEYTALQDLAEAQASWALKEYRLAIDSAETAFDSLKGNEEAKQAMNSREDMTLLWASRAVVVGKPEIATKILSTNTKYSSANEWRKESIEAMVLCANNQVDEAVKIFAKLEQNVKHSGLHDAIATAVIIIAEQNGDPTPLLSKLSGNSGALAAWKAGNAQEATNLVDSAIFQRFLEGGL